jgi:hypothetical protein
MAEPLKQYYNEIWEPIKNDISNKLTGNLWLDISFRFNDLLLDNLWWGIRHALREG